MTPRQRDYARAILRTRHARQALGQVQEEEFRAALALPPAERDAVHITLVEEPALTAEHRERTEAERLAQAEALREEGRQAERAAVVAWLRRMADRNYEGDEEETLRQEAGFIERGSHLTKVRP